MDVLAERSYPTPLSNSSLLPLLLLSLTSQRYTPNTSTWINHEYDYIVVGGGAAGSVVASRLSEEPCVSVLLLEAGGKPPILTEVPALSDFFLGTDVDFNFQTVPQKHAASGLVNRQIKWPLGKMEGGSGNHNGMIYVRGNRKNYDDWEAQGAKGWSYDKVFPYFLKLEDNTSPAFLADGYHATGGPITVEQPKYYPEIKQAIREAATALGYQFVDPNAGHQTGFYDLQGNMRNGQRCSSLKGYLVPAENRTNLDILINAMVTKVIIEDGRATGVEYYREGQFGIVKSRREVILSAGTVNTPKILMLSGIGPREELQKWNIPLVEDLPVGKNLQDHVTTRYLIRKKPHSKTFDEKLSDPENIFEYIRNRSGPLSSSSFYVSAFLNGQNAFHAIDFPNYYISLEEDRLKSLREWGLKPEVYKQFIEPYEADAIMTCLVQQLQPKSKGTVTLSSSNPFDPPLIDPNYLEYQSDLQALVDGLKMCKKLVNTPPLVNMGVKPFETLVPGCEKYADFDDEYFQCYAKSIPFSSYHPVGTSKMGDPEDPTTVVDPELRVKNIEGLRVVDASVMPIIISGNTNIPTIMIAEKASDMIKDSISC